MLKWIIGGLATILSVGYLSRLQKTGSTITSRVRLQIHKITLTGMELKAIVQLQNPNPISLRIQHPFVKVLYGDKMLGSSEIENKVLDVDANSQQTFELLIVSAGWLTLIQILGTTVVKDIREGKPIQLPLETIITTRVNGLPYEQRETINIQL